MTTAALLLRAKEAGITVRREGEALRYRGPNEAIAKWLPALKEHKAEVLEVLKADPSISQNTLPEGPQKPQRASDCPASTSWGWRLTYPDGRVVEVFISPRATRERVMTTYPEAIDAEPHEPAVTLPEAPITTDEEVAIRRWLKSIMETDEAVIGEVMAQCRRDANARAYFLGRSEEAPRQDDDRRFCRTCRNFRGNRDPETGYCSTFSAHVVDWPPRRCLGYVSLPGDPDQRSGRQRWPALGVEP